jgi:hypothetical protein
MKIFVFGGRVAVNANAARSEMRLLAAELDALAPPARAHRPHADELLAAIPEDSDG